MSKTIKGIQKILEGKKLDPIVAEIRDAKKSIVRAIDRQTMAMLVAKYMDKPAAYNNKTYNDAQEAAHDVFAAAISNVACYRGDMNIVSDDDDDEEVISPDEEK